MMYIVVGGSLGTYEKFDILIRYLVELSHRKLTISIWSSREVGDKYLNISHIKIVFIDAIP